MLAVLAAIRRVFQVLFLVVIGAIVFASFYFGPELSRLGKNYSFPEVAIDATVQQDGSLAVVERRTFDFHGSFTFAYFTIDHRQPGDVSKFSIRDDTTEYKTFLSPGGPAGPISPGALSIEDSASQFKATWYYDITDRARTFTIRYRFACAVQLLDDGGAYLNWQSIGTGWDKPTDHARITIHMPGNPIPPRPGRPARPCTPGGEPLAGRTTPSTPLAKTDVKAFGHGPLQGSVFVRDGQTVVLDYRDLKGGQFVEASLVFPDAAVPFVGPPSGPVVGPDAPAFVTTAGEVLAAEARLAKAANRQRSLNDLLLGATKAVAIAFVPFLIWMIVLAFRRDRVPDVPKLLQEPPENAHPAELALLWSAYRGTFAPKDAYRAQLLSLAQKGVIGVVAEGQVSNPKDMQIRLLEEPTDRLDREFVEFLFDADAGPLPGPTQAPVKLSDAVKARGGRTAALTGWWKYAAAKARGPIERIKDGQTRMESVLAFLFAAAVAAGGYFTATYLGIRGGLFLIPFALVGWIVATRIIPARLPTDLRTRLAKWRAFRRFLTQFQGLADAPALAVIIWERYLVYATALGVAETVTKQIRALIPEGSLPAPWPGALPGSTGYLWASHFSSGAPAHAAVSTSASVAGQITWSGSWGSSSGGGGGGGGSSGGGGGGGGGSGGGAG